MSSDFKTFPEGVVKVDTDAMCDVCQKEVANYYSTTWYLHICSLKCFNSFLYRYNKEINSIAFEIKKAEDLGDTSEV